MIRTYLSPTLEDRGAVVARTLGHTGFNTLEAVSLKKNHNETASDSSTQSPSITASNDD